MNSLTPIQLKEIISKKSSKQIIIDARTPAEFHLEHIEGAVNMPYDQFEDYKEELKKYENIAVYCNSGNTSAMFYKRATSSGITTINNVTGGIAACRGHCTIIKQKGALPMMQQVQIVAGGLVLLGIILAKSLHQYEWHEYFIGLSAFVGAGLVFAGVTGRCGMAKILAKMPWNQVKDTAQPSTVTGKNLLIKQFEDKNLAHYSYMAISNGEAVVVDPERDPQKYYDFAAKNNAKIVGVLNTHPHADFASGHLQISQDTGATIYVGEKVGADYPHTAVSDQTIISFGSSKVVCYFTPGHSPDSISYLVQDEQEKEVGFFTGDWLFIGDVGRADLRETVGNIKAKQEELAGMMFDTTRTILPKLSDQIMILPAHGAGTSCGKGLSKQSMDTLSNQRKYNPMLQEMARESFVQELTSDQPSIPAYFTNSVLLNKKGNSSFEHAIAGVQIIDNLKGLDNVMIIDTRPQQKYFDYPLVENSINIPHDNKGFTGMVGAIVQPTEKYILIIEQHSDKYKVLHDVLSIGYENNLVGVYVLEDIKMSNKIHQKDLETSDYQILDVRSESVFGINPVHTNAVNIPIEQLVSRIAELSKEKTYIPYCGGTFKSGIAYSILKKHGFDVKIHA